MREFQVISPAALLLAAWFTGGCDRSDDAPFHDKGEGTWLAMLNVPEIAYRAMWGADASDVYAVGAGGFAHHDGLSWQRVSDVPEVEYRAVWGRSSAQVWVGGDNTLLAKSLTGWQKQTLWHGDFEIVAYSVLALIGDSRREYALVFTGGQVLLLINEGAAWRALGSPGLAGSSLRRQQLRAGGDGVRSRDEPVASGVGRRSEYGHGRWRWRDIRAPAEGVAGVALARSASPYGSPCSPFSSKPAYPCQRAPDFCAPYRS